MDIEDGIIAVKAARRYAEAETKREKTEISFPEAFLEKKGVFVTILSYPGGVLRGCIGYPEPVLSCKDALMMSAMAACHDPRFDDLSFPETDRCTFEITVLTTPEVVEYRTPDELLSKIEVGKDGLILTYEGRRGLLLPQVPTEFGWDAEEYLRHLSMKAGLNPGMWREPAITIESFRGEIFSETSPRGEIVRK